MMKAKSLQDSLDEFQLARAEVVNQISIVIRDFADRVWFWSVRMTFRVEKRRVEKRRMERDSYTPLPSRCPQNHWQPGMGPCICEGRVHPMTWKEPNDD